jgi:adenosylhomocysteine nucleosidase
MANNGVHNSGSGNITISGSAIGRRSSVTNVRQEPAGEPGKPEHPIRSDVGVITILSEETNAVVAMLKASGTYHKLSGPDGLIFHEADIDVVGRNMKVIAAQALSQGQQSSVIAYNHLRQFCRPSITVLVGIAGGINARIKLGDVVVVRDVVYYDRRKELPGQTVRRGEARSIPATVRRAVNDFFSSGDEPRRSAIMGRSGVLRTCSVWPGLIGSGEAVIADRESDIRRYLTEFNDKALAVEMEAKGVADAFYEAVGADRPAVGWFAIRGISDHAGEDKDDAYHEIASWHAAMVLYEMLPYLAPLTTAASGLDGS